MLHRIIVASAAASNAQSKEEELRARLAIGAPDSIAMKTHLELAYLLEYENPGVSLEEAQHALELATKAHDGRNAAQALRQRGAAFTNLSMFPSAMESYYESIKRSESAGDEKGVASAWTAIGILQERSGDLQEALQSHQRSLAIKEKLGYSNGISNSYHQMGYVYEAMGDLPQALEHFQRGLDIRTEDRDTLKMLSSLTHVAEVLGMMGKVDTAMTLFDQCYELSTLMGDHERRISVLFLQGELFLEQRDPRSALDRIERIERIATEQHMQLSLCEAFSVKGDIAMERSDHGAAIGRYEKALAIAAELRSARMRHGSLERLMNAHFKARHIDEAFRYMDDFMASRDTLRELRNTEKLNSLELDHEFRSSQATDSLQHAAAMDQMENLRTIEQLRADRNRNRALAIGGGAALLLVGGGIWFYTDRKRRKERFDKEAATLETQALRSQMNPHFIFNALNSINAYVQKNDPDNATSYLTKFARVMRSVLENSRHSEVHLQEDLETLRGYMELERKRMNEKFDFTIEVAEDIDPEEVLVPPLVVQPFVENAIWHGMTGKEGKGHISLRVDRKGSQLLWTIEDDGAGRFKKKGGAPNPGSGQPVKKTSLGTSITRSRLDLVQQQHGGKAGFQYYDLKQGTRVVVDMPFVTD